MDELGILEAVVVQLGLGGEHVFGQLVGEVLKL